MADQLSSKSKPNIRMVAERAQLSPATVSLALRGSPSIAAETRERVLAAARELNYVPAPRANRVVPANEPQLLFISKDFGEWPVASNPFHGGILSAAEQECAEQGARLVFVLLPEADRTEEQLHSLFAGRKIDGVLLIGAYAPALVRQVAEIVSAPLVLVDNVVPGINCDSIMADDFGGALLSTNHLIERGHRHIAAVVGTMASPSLAARYRGYTYACEVAGITPTAPLETAWERASLRSALEGVLLTNPRPTAIFCATDAYAVFAMDVLRDFGLQVPNDISVVGFDDFPIARMAHPSLTTLHNHPSTLGRLAVQRLLARISGDDTPSLNITVTTQLIIRESTRSI